MQISCPKCATAYTLDERLLPPGGAPVQCTQCGLVFTATPQGAQLPAAAPDSAKQAQPNPSGEAASSERKTPLFGGAARSGGAAATDGGRQTQMFGAPVPTAPSTGVGRSTQMFGAPVPAAPATGPGRTTQMFGGAAPAAAPPPAAPSGDVGRHTQLFGAPVRSSGAAAPADAGRSTQMFGAPPVAAGTPPADAGRSTQMFGAPPVAAGAPPADPSRSTQVFGVPPVVAAARPTDAGRSTQMFGVAPVAAGAPPADPSRSTQVFGVSPVAAGARPPDVGRSTQMFGAPPVAAGVPPADVSRSTQMFGAPPSVAGTPPLDPARQTQVFGSSPVGLSGPRFGGAAAETTRRNTPPFGSATSNPLIGAEEAGELDDDLSIGTEEGPQSGRLELPPEPMDLLPDTDPPDEAVETVMRAQARTRQRVVWIALFIGLVALGAVGARWAMRRAKALPLEAVTAREAAFDLLRRDDGRSRARAAEQLQRLAQAHPGVMEIQAEEVLALSLELDELKLRIHHLKVESDAARAQIVRLQERQTPSDWRTRVDERRHDLEQMKAESDPLITQAEALDAELNHSFQALAAISPADDAGVPLGVLRAQAVYFAVKGSDQSVALAERYRRLGGADGWDAIAFAEYALNARVAPGTQQEALTAIEGLKAQDSGLLRAYVLSARLRQVLKDFPGATQDLEAVAALNPHHETARQLLAWQRPVEAPPPAP